MTRAALLHRRTSPSLATVLARFPTATLLAALLAFMAIAGMFALSTWHASQIHDDRSAQLASPNDVHPGDHDHQGDDDPNAAMHLMAHQVGHSLALPAGTAIMLATVVASHIWSAEIRALRPGPEPASLLRPPRI